ncbi:hypothetical protein ASD11_14840 [Aeromicrobium sp. Root495]|nr:hypothetical protein ASD11_14840 [Aeromicrobium sp. Root495]
MGEVSSELNLPSSTIRTWERRYGLNPSVRTAGGHRRYDTDDVERLRLMTDLVNQGVSPAEAAGAVRRSRLAGTTSSSGQNKAARELWADEVLAAARELDAARIHSLLGSVLSEQGAKAAWMFYLTPMLQRVGEEWTAGILGIDAEHLVSELATNALRAYLHALPIVEGPVEVVLACAEEDQHVLPLLALQCTLAEHGVATQAFGQRMPAAAIADVVARARPRALFLWASLPRPRGDRLHRVATALAARTTVVLGGPGWADVDVARARSVHDLPSALTAVMRDQFLVRDLLSPGDLELTGP